MNRKDFNDQITRLTSVYGTSKYPMERVEMIFKAVCLIDFEYFENQVSEFIGSSDKPPYANDFRMALHGIISDAIKKSIEERVKKLPSCLNCDNTGHARMYDKETGFEYAYQCTCERGHMFYPRYEKQYPNMGEKFVSHRMWSSSKWSRLDATRNYYKKNNPEKPVEIKGMSRPNYDLDKITTATVPNA